VISNCRMRTWKAPHHISRYPNTSVSPSSNRLLFRLRVCIMSLVHCVSSMSQQHLVLVSVSMLIHGRKLGLGLVPFRSQQHLVVVLVLVYERLGIPLLSVGISRCT
jgi:hypothetical protein